jgi:hypothetical protein
MNRKQLAQELVKTAKGLVAGDEWMDKNTYAFAKQVAGVMKRERNVRVTGVSNNRIDFVHQPNLLVSVPLVLTMMEFGYPPDSESVNGEIFSEKERGFRIPGGTTTKRDPNEFWNNAKDSLNDILTRAGV